MSQINIRNLSNENDDGSPEIVGVSTFSATSFFVPPKGSTAERPSDCEPGSIRFNTDTANLEYFRGKGIGWSQFELVTPNLGGGTGSNTGFGVRGIFVGGYAPSQTDIIDFITISTLGNSQDFGDLNSGYSAGAATNDRTRGFYSGGNTGNQLDMRFCTLASMGDSVDGGGDLVVATKGSPTGNSSSTRGVISGGRDHPGAAEVNVIQYHTIQSLGNASDFGDLLNPRSYSGGNCQSSTRGIIAAGFLPAAPTRTNSIEFITMASLGNSTDFGDLATAVSTLGAASNSTRGIFAGGSSPTALRDMQFITIATAGDAQDFGDLDNGGDFNHVKGDVGCCTSPTRCVIGGGSVPGGTGMQFVEIASTGGGTDFGEFGVHAGHRQDPGMWSTGHGGL